MGEHVLDRLVREQHLGRAAGITSVCSAHPTVLEETVRHGADGEHVVLVEATCNQVNQDGGYTGMRPADFRSQVEQLADEHGLPPERLVLGGDHLGPNPWRHLPADTAMAKSVELVEAFVTAGFTKIHLDTSIRCADDPVGALHPALVAERSAVLAVAAERAASAAGVEPRYVVGTEVPVPGGESAGEHGIHVTTADDVEETIELTESAFLAAGVPEAWDRVRAVVAQPGVEFSDAELFRYAPGQAEHLARFIAAEPLLVFEAHSTDYQSLAALRALVRDGFAVLKVGPALTFAYREAVFALSYVEDELLGDDASGVRGVLDAAMVARPGYWQGFYPADPARAAYARKWSRSDRSRYYWPVPEVRVAVERLVANLHRTGIPDELASQFLPLLAGGAPEAVLRGPDPEAVLRGPDPEAVLRGPDPEAVLRGPDPEAVLRSAVRQVLDLYRQATSPTP